MSVSGTYSLPGPTRIFTPGESSTTAGRLGRRTAGRCKVPNNFCPAPFSKVTARTSDIVLLQPLQGHALQLPRTPIERFDLAPERLFDDAREAAARIQARQLLQVFTRPG